MTMTGTASRTKQSALARRVEKIVASTPVFDIHTHLYDPAFKDLLLWGIDELLVYHYLVAEAFRYFDTPYEQFWALPRTRQAELIWDALFVQHSPLSEACRGVLTTLNLLGIDARKRDLPALRRWFAKQNGEKHLTRCLELAKVERICMTNSPFDDLERPVWEKGFRRDERFVAALRVDPLLLAWNDTALMLGVRRAVNPALRLAGDGVGLADLQSLQNLCAGFPENKFLVTALSRENQHELCVLARKFRNLHVFGCWWFTNVPHVMEEMTRMRVELIGLSVTAQQSDARVLDQLVYKWSHFREIMSRALADRYLDLSRTGWEPTA